MNHLKTNRLTHTCIVSMREKKKKHQHTQYPKKKPQQKKLTEKQQKQNPKKNPQQQKLALQQQKAKAATPEEKNTAAEADCGTSEPESELNIAPKVPKKAYISFGNKT